MNNKDSKRLVKIPEIVSVKRFSEILDLPVGEVIEELLKNQIVATINEEIDFDTASIIADDLGFEAEKDLEVKDDEVLTLEKLLEICQKEKESKENFPIRPPVVTILGHVDHGKTTLLDTIRKTNVVGEEVGGITQRISAYQVKKRGKGITFIDTPGHEAFSSMRERGVSLADIAILVVAADDGVRPQTKEVIDYLKEKKILTIVAINKVDKPEANLNKVKQELADHEIMIEEWGGEVLCSEISAKHNKGIDGLLDNILLLEEVGELRSDNKREGLGVILESHLDPQKGPVATVLVKTGTLKVGHDILAGKTWGRIRRMEDFSGKNVPSAGPSMPVTIIGLNKTPYVNDVLQVRKEVSSRMKLRSNLDLKKTHSMHGNKGDSEEEIKKLNIVIKVDVQGSLEAIRQILDTIKSDEVVLNYIETGVGSITESDVKMATSADALIFGFNSNPTPVASRMAEVNKVKIQSFDIIYELLRAVKQAMGALLPPEVIRTDLGRLKVLAIFKTGKKDMIVGGRVIEGKMVKGKLLEIKREGEVIGSGRLANLQQNKKNTEEVGKGNECGLTYEGSVKIMETDLVICYSEEEKKRKI